MPVASLPFPLDICRGSVRLTFFRSGARGLYVPGALTPEPAKHEARKRRVSERPRVACREELGARVKLVLPIPQRKYRTYTGVDQGGTKMTRIGDACRLKGY